MMTTPAPQPRRARAAKTMHPLRVYATADPRAYECSSETAPDTRYLVEIDLECCSCRHGVASLIAALIGDPSRVCKHIVHVRDTRLGDVIPLTVMPSGDDAPTYEPDPFASATVVDGDVRYPPLKEWACWSPPPSTQGAGFLEVGSECDVCVAAELCL